MEALTPKQQIDLIVKHRMEVIIVRSAYSESEGDEYYVRVHATTPIVGRWFEGTTLEHALRAFSTAMNHID